MYKENWENVFGDVPDIEEYIIGAKKCITLLSSPLWTTNHVREFYERGSLTSKSGNLSVAGVIKTIHTELEDRAKTKPRTFLPETPEYRNEKEGNRDWNRHSGCSYRTRRELDEAAGNTDVVDRLIEKGILELHKKWKYPRTVIEVSPFIIVHNPDVSRETYKLMDQIWAGKHPEAPYRLNIGALDEIVYGEENAREERGALLYGHFVGKGNHIPVCNRDGEFSHWTPRIV